MRDFECFADRRLAGHKRVKTYAEATQENRGLLAKSYVRSATQIREMSDHDFRGWAAVAIHVDPPLDEEALKATEERFYMIPEAVRAS